MDLRVEKEHIQDKDVFSGLQKAGFQPAAIHLMKGMDLDTQDATGRTVVIGVERFVARSGFPSALRRPLQYRVEVNYSAYL